MTVTVESLPTVAAPAAAARSARVAGAEVPARGAVRGAAVRGGVAGSGRPVRRTAAPRRRVVTGASACAASAPQPVAASSAVQLTRRGWTVLVTLSLAVAAVLVWVAFLSHPAPGAGAGAAGAAPAQVVVQAGDTLWTIAGRIAPERDPRAVVYDLQQANGLADSTVVEGQVLRVG